MKLSSITNPFPALAEGAVTEDVWELFREFPHDYQAFLLAQNGGFVDEFQYTFQTGVPFKTESVDNPSRDDCPVEFFGLPTLDIAAASTYPDDLLQVAVDHHAEAFLPSNLIAIARCVQNSLVCMSIAGEDRGAVYYWDWYWQYPWCKEFFERRIAAVDHPDIADVHDDPQHPAYQAVVDAYNYATVVKLADSFGEWLESCVDARDDEGAESA